MLLVLAHAKCLSLLSFVASLQLLPGAHMDIRLIFIGAFEGRKYEVKNCEGEAN
ncbi:hypothetical protein HCH_02119 [Hahella chejuensis KCTC 2396]|uniref:Uncharacterized protein n=1 Tax=Hahella chejuensis (strain KCTC 2396) TaxID=349521 RepID=Q2SK77_HAHCH|nr:hypothetical protein HCH_02119 [Hahella chejuensis KCTC 2396]